MTRSLKTAAIPALIPALSYLACLYYLTTSWVPENAVDQFLQMRPLPKLRNILQILLLFLYFWVPTLGVIRFWRKLGQTSQEEAKASPTARAMTEATVLSGSVQALCIGLELLIVVWLTPALEGFIRETGSDPEAVQRLFDISHLARRFLPHVIGGSIAVLAVYVLLFRCLYRFCGRMVGWGFSSLLSLIHGCVLGHCIECLFLWSYVPMAHLKD